VLLDLRVQVGQVDVPGLVARHDHDPHPREDRRGGVGAVRAGGDQAQVAVGLAAGVLPGPDRQEPGELPLGAGVGLHGDRGVPADFGEPGLQLLDEDLPAAGLVGGGEGVDVGELGPGDRLHLGGGVELHGAGPERDHAAVEPVVLVRQALQVAHHGGLGVVGGEHRVRQVRRLAPQTRRDADRRAGGERGTEGVADGVQVGVGGGLVAGDRDGVGAGAVEVDACLGRGGDDLIGPAGHGRGDGVEAGVAGERDAGGLEGRGQARGGPGGVLGDAAQALGAVPDGVGGGDDGREHLGGADVAGGLLTADVLFAGLECQAQGGGARGVAGDADEPAGQLALEGVADGHVSGVGAAEAHGHAQALGGADGDVGAEFAGGGQEGEGEEVGGDGDEGAGRVGGVDRVRPVVDGAVGSGVLQEDAEGALGDRGRVGEVGGLEGDADRFGAGAQDREGLREDAVVDGEDVPGGLFCGPAGQEHGFGGGGGFVEEAGAGDGQAGEVGAHGLEVQERFEAALGDLGLVGRVRGVPGGVLQDVAADDGGGVGAVVAQADHGAGGPVLGGEVGELGLGPGLGDRGGEGEAVRGADEGGHAGVHERVEAGLPDGLEHGVLVGGAGADVAGGERAVGHEGSPVTGRRQLRSPRLSPAPC
jgi:hypothetical protein